MKTREPQYQVQADGYEASGPVTLGLTTSHIWRSDPRHLLFFLSRYKFVAKMLAGYDRVLEVGCGDGFGSRLLSQNKIHVTGVDFDPVFIEEARRRESDDGSRVFEVHDFLDGPMAQKFDAAFSLDVIEHIRPDDEDRFIRNVCASIRDGGACIFGSPSLESQIHASQWSKAGHVNCKSAPDWQATFRRFFEHAFIFSMNDEVLHTGFAPMSHYIFTLCVGPKRDGA
jgi:2-polyprenyl-3-methyl-5-hydroxy-6-metoxy-1,4-benzoquinol methylase